MVNKVSLTCPTCGGKLIVSPDMNRFACAYCGNDHIVLRGEGTISLQPVVEELKNVQQGVDKTASELAIKRLHEEIALLRRKRTQDEGGWYGNRLGWGCLAVFLAAFPAFFCNMASSESGWFSTPSSTLWTIVAFTLPFIIAFFVFRTFRKEKEKEKEKWKRLDTLIASKEDELLYHQDLVSRY